MGYQDFSILIVDDDRSFAESLKEGFVRAGFRCFCVHTPEDALNYTKLQEVHVLIVDCMLPKMNGLELVKKMKENFQGTPHLFLTSGIFKDKQFISSAIQKTGATEFLPKPLDIGSFISQVKTLFSVIDDTEDNFNPLMKIYLDRDLNSRRVIKLINDSEGLHNFDLPWVFKILAECKCTGHLNIACTNGDIAGVGFSQGSIVQVNIKNEASLLGLLLVEQGYLDRRDLKHALENNNNNKRIGQFLVEKNLVSPHAINIVLKEQLIWRLKRLIADSQMELNFVKSDDVATIATVEHADFMQFIVDTVENTIRADWLKTHYLPLSQNLISVNKSALDQIGKAKIYPFVSRTYSSFDALLGRETTLEEILTKNHTIEASVLKVIHFFNIMGYIQIRNDSKSLNFAHQTKRLQKLQVELENKNYFERLGVSRSAKDADIKKAYFDLAKVLHPDKLSQSAPAQIKELSEKVFEKIQVAYDTLKKAERKEKYLAELEAGQTEKFMKGDQFFDSGKAFLAKGQYSEARQHLQQAMKYNPNSPEIKIHSIWAEIKVTKGSSESHISELDKKLNQIPIESRDSAAYYLARGLYYKLTGDIERARKYFNTALNIDQGFISARRELSQLGSKKEVTNILNANVKDVFGMLFKK